MTFKLIFFSFLINKTYLGELKLLIFRNILNKKLKM
jgi:hypothetical protein